MNSYKKLALPLLLLLNFTASVAMDVPSSSSQTTKRKREDNVESRSSKDKETFNEQEETKSPSKKRRDSPESLEDSTELSFIELPGTIQAQIFKYLEEDDLLRTRKVCSKFKDQISSFATLCPHHNGKGALIANQNIENFTELTEIIRNPANQNSPEKIASAYFGLGELYLRGAFKNPNYQKALNSYNKSIKLGYSPAFVRKALMYEEGLGGLKDLLTAAFHYKGTSYETREEALFQLGILFLKGPKFLRDYSKAFELYKRLAAQDHPAALFQLGYMYEEGYNVEKDIRIAIEFYQKAADHGDATAQWVLGDHYKAGEGVEQDYLLAIYWYEQAANQGYSDAQFALGLMYEEGKGVEQNYPLASQWYHRAAAQNKVEALEKLGSMYLEGRGVEKNLERANSMFRAANTGRALVARNNVAILSHPSAQKG